MLNHVDLILNKQNFMYLDNYFVYVVGTIGVKPSPR